MITFELKTQIMNDEEKFNLKLKLLIGLSTPKDIQHWAEDTILKNPYNEFALQICFMESQDQIYKYFFDLNPELLSVKKDKIALSVLEQYLIVKLPQQIDEKFESHIHNLTLLSEYFYEVDDYIHEGSLFTHIIIYDDMIQCETDNELIQNIYIELCNFLNRWIISASNVLKHTEI